ncbi:MAG: LemA family protein [Bacilli bacterium]
MVLYIILGIVVILILLVIGNYNKLVVLRNRVKDQWSQIDVQLKRRVDLIPNLVETVKGYAKHEKETFDSVIKARNSFNSATTPTEEMNANGELTQALGRLFALAESYPDLKANENFVNLQNQLKEVEEKIAYARQFYNDTVLSLNNKVEMFPSSIIANMFNFKKEKFFEIDEADRKTPEVKF